MDRREESERKRKAAAQSNQTMDKFFKKIKPEETVPTKVLETKAEDVNRNEVSTKPSQTSSHFGDIGNIVNATMTTEEINVNIRKLSDADKYDLLKNHVKPIPEFNFPSPRINDFLEVLNLSGLIHFLGWSSALSWMEHFACPAFCFPN